MNTVLVSLIIIIAIIAISLLVILFNMNSKSKNTNIKKNVNKNNNKSKPVKLDINNIKLPKKISQMDYISLSKASKQVFESFKALDYVNKPSIKLDKVEWHTWQVSLLMGMLKAEKGFFVPRNDSFFHKVILSNNKNSIVQLTQRIVDKYNNNININKSRDELSSEIFWSSREVSILFYYMSKY